MKQPIRKQLVKHKEWCASVTMILTSDPPQIPPCDCVSPVGEDTRPKDWVKLGLSPSTKVENWPLINKYVPEKQMIKLYYKTAVQPMYPWEPGELMDLVSVSAADASNGSPKEGDMIAYNPENRTDVWLVAAEFFKLNYELIGESNE